MIEQWCGSLLVSVTLSCVLRLTINTKYQNSICLIHPPILCNSFITYTLLTTTLYNILITFTDVDTYVECFLTFTVVKATYIYVCVCWQLNCVSICFFVFLHFQLLTTTLCNIFITLSLLHFSCVICVGIKNQSVSIMRGSKWSRWSNSIKPEGLEGYYMYWIL